MRSTPAQIVARFFTALARCIETRRGLVLFSVLAALALAAWPLSHASFRGDLIDLLPADSRAANAFKKYRERFEQSDQLLVVAVERDAEGASGAPPASPTPQQWIASLRERLTKRDPPLRLENGPLETVTTFVKSVLPRAGFLYLTPAEANRLHLLLTPAGIEQALARSRRILEESPGLETSELVRRDPLLLRELLADRAAQFFGGAPIGADAGSKYALLSIVGPRPAQDLPASRELVGAVNAEIDALGRPPNLRILLTGGYAIAVEDETTIRQDLGSSTGSSILLVALLGYASYRSFKPLLLSMATLTVAIAWAYGLFLALRGGITVITAVGAAMLFGLGDDLGVHLYSELKRLLDSGVDLKTARRAMLELSGPRILVATLTSVGCFLSFALTGFRGLADLGLLSAIGLLACLVAYVTLFPALLARHVPRPGVTLATRFSNLLVKPPLSWPRATLAASLLVTAAAVGVLVVEGVPPFTGDARTLHTDQSPAMQALAELDRRVQRPLVPWVLLAEGKSPEDLSHRFAALEEPLRKLVQDGALVSYQLPTQVLPPRDQQAQAAGAFARVDPEQVARTLREKAAELDFDANAFESTETMLHANLTRAESGAPLTLDELRELGAGSMVDTFFRASRGPGGSRDGDWIAAGFLFTRGGLLPGPEQEQALARTQQALRPWKDFSLTGFQVVSAELAERVRADFRGVTALATGVVLLLVLIGSGSLSATLYALIPVAISFLWLLAGMRLFGASFNVMNIVLLPMLVGLGVDNGVHLVFDARHTGDASASLRAVLPPMLVSNVTTLAGFGSLVTVHQPAIALMGALTAGGLGFCLLATVVVLAPILRLRTRRDQNPK